MKGGGVSKRNNIAVGELCKFLFVSVTFCGNYGKPLSLESYMPVCGQATEHATGDMQTTGNVDL